MSRTVFQRETVSLNESDESVPCPACGTSLSRYISKCPTCGRHAHRLSHDEILQRRNRLQKWAMILGAIGTFVLVMALYWLLGGSSLSTLLR